MKFRPAGNSAITAVNDLLKVANKIYVVNILDSLQADQVLIEKIKNSNKVDLFLGYGVKEIKGENTLEGIALYSQKTKEEKFLKVKGVFIEIGLIPNSEFVKGFINLNNKKEIIVDCDCRTNIPGIFAAGDVTSVTEKQIIVAAGEGAKASLSAYKYLLGLK
jgi:alkyl hydroperoxide reductase subunit F